MQIVLHWAFIIVSFLIVLNLFTYILLFTQVMENMQFLFENLHFNMKCSRQLMPVYIYGMYYSIHSVSGEVEYKSTLKEISLSLYIYIYI